MSKNTKGNGWGSVYSKSAFTYTKPKKEPIPSITKQIIDKAKRLIGWNSEE